jgi:uncharacterized protein
MPRPKKCRTIRYVPSNQAFYPHEKSGETITLSFEEVEAIRLSDLELLDQDECSESMKISRGTFQRIINSARNKMADAVINGKAIVIEGGDFEVASCEPSCHGRCKRFKCCKR